MWLRLFRWELKVLNWNICFVNLHLNIFWIFFNWSHLTFTDNISTVSVSKFKIEFIFAIAKLYSYWYCGETFQSCFFGSSQTAPSNSIRHQPSCRLPSSSSQDDKTLYWHAGPGARAIQLLECPFLLSVHLVSSNGIISGGKTAIFSVPSHIFEEKNAKI